MRARPAQSPAASVWGWFCGRSLLFRANVLLKYRAEEARGHTDEMNDPEATQMLEIARG
jgi:hypothetical protein